MSRIANADPRVSLRRRARARACSELFELMLGAAGAVLFRGSRSARSGSRQVERRPAPRGLPAICPAAQRVMPFRVEGALPISAPKRPRLGRCSPLLTALPPTLPAARRRRPMRAMRPRDGARAKRSRHATAPKFDWLRHAPPVEGDHRLALPQARPPSTASGLACCWNASRAGLQGRGMARPTSKEGWDAATDVS